MNLLEHFVKNCKIFKWTESGEAITKLCEKAISNKKSVYDDVINCSLEKCNFDEIMVPLTKSDSEYSSVSSYISFFQYVSSNVDQRDCSTKCDKLMNEFNVDLNMNKKLFNKYVQCQEFEKDLSDPQKIRLLNDRILEGKNYGLNRDDETISKVKDLTKNIEDLCIKFNNNLNNNKSHCLFSKDELKGIPQDIIDNYVFNEETQKYVVTMKYPDYIPLSKLCNNSETRKTATTAFNSRCVDENTPILEEIIKLRHQRATILGYPTHADLILQRKMAKSHKNVDYFLDDIISKISILFEKERTRLLVIKDSVCKELGIPFDNKINAWDVGYYMNKVEETDYKVDHESLKVYFDFNKVLEKILSLYQSLLKLEFIKVENAPVWHEEVTLYAVIERDECEENGDILGYFYLDLHPRENKYNHAACFPLQYRIRKSSDSKEFNPALCAMVANFNKPKNKETPCLFNHSEVETFFHEFGHVMHHICSVSKYVDFSGFSVESDFVEAPSQMLENWVWNKKVLKLLSGHVETGDPLSDEMCDLLIKSRKANAAHFYMRQVSFCKFDQAIHTQEGADTAKQVQKAFESYWKIDSIPGTNFSASFGHMTGGYDARYYGYLWSEVYSHDMYVTKFASKGLELDPKTGLEYRKSILEPGGSKDAMEMLIDFLGREPSTEAFIKQLS